MSHHTTTLLAIAVMLPAVTGPLFHRVGLHIRVNSIEFTLRLMAARGAA